MHLLMNFGPTESGKETLASSLILTVSSYLGDYSGLQAMALAA